jgi:hypothetical protein
MQHLYFGVILSKKIGGIAAYVLKRKNKRGEVYFFIPNTSLSIPLKNLGTFITVNRIEFTSICSKTN